MNLGPEERTHASPLHCAACVLGPRHVSGIVQTLLRVLLQFCRHMLYGDQFSHSPIHCSIKQSLVSKGSPIHWPCTVGLTPLWQVLLRVWVPPGPHVDVHIVQKDHNVQVSAV